MRSFPWGVRAVLGYDAELCASAARAFAIELMRSLRRRAKKLFGLGSVQDAFTGAVVAIPRTDSALRVNVHLHVLALDGVYVRDLAGTLVFHPLPTPDAEDVARIARRTAERLGSAFEAQGRHSPWQPAEASEPDPEPLRVEQPGLFACYEAAARGISVSGERAGQPALRLVVGQGLAPGGLPRERAEPADPAAPVAEALGISVYAKQLVDGRDRTAPAPLAVLRRGPMRGVAAATGAEAISRLLAKHGLAPRLHLRLARRPAQTASSVSRSRARLAERRWPP